MAQRYRKIDPRIWNDEKFRALSREEKLVALYVLTSQSNRLGFFKFSKALAAEDLNMSPEAFTKAFERVCRALAWRFDAEARVVLIPKWFRYNRPDNPNVLKSCLEDLHDLPHTSLIGDFAACVVYLPPSLHDAFRKGFEERYGERSGERMPLLEQEQEQEQEQDSTPPKSPPRSRGGSAFDWSAVVIPPGLGADDAIRKAVEEWLEYRRRIGKPYRMPEKQISLLLARYGNSITEAIYHSIGMGWQGCFLPDKEKTHDNRHAAGPGQRHPADVQGRGW